jgi:hypothetical protein
LVPPNVLTALLRLGLVQRDSAGYTASATLAILAGVLQVYLVRLSTMLRNKKIARVRNNLWARGADAAPVRTLAQLLQLNKFESANMGRRE